MPTNDGESGSPVFVASGEVVAIKKGSFRNGQDRSLLVPMSAAKNLLNRVDDLEQPCEIVSENDPMATILPPYKVLLKIDSRDVDVFGSGFKFPCGNREHHFEVQFVWDLTQLRVPNHTDHCQDSLTTDPGTRYYIRAHGNFDQRLGSLVVDSCKLLPKDGSNN